jgi:hypothetical protein
MPLMFVLDRGVPRGAAGLLCDFGHKCIHAGEVGMSKATDEEIFGFRIGEKRRRGATSGAIADSESGRRRGRRASM